MNASELEYELPPELIAQHPLERRDDSRLLVYSRATRRDPPLAGSATCRASCRPGTLAVVNDTRVVPARIRIERPRGEVLLLERLERRGVGGARAADAAAAGRAGGTGRSSCSSTSARAGGACACTGEPAGEAPLPPYITEPLADPERYQTVYATAAGLGGGADRRAALHARAARAARRRARHPPRRPRHLPAARRASGSRSTRSTASATRSTPEAWERIGPPSACSPSARRPCGCSRRSHEARRSPAVRSCSSLPGFEFRRVDALLTNFHLPRSTLLALVMAFAGVEETRRLYRLAVEERYRFYSFGDAMLDPLTRASFRVAASGATSPTRWPDAVRRIRRDCRRFAVALRAEPVEEPRRSRDVGEDERDRPGRRVAARELSPTRDACAMRRRLDGVSDKAAACKGAHEWTDAPV